MSSVSLRTSPVWTWPSTVAMAVARKIGAIHHRFGAHGGKVVAIERDVEHADWRHGTFKVRDLRGHSFGKRDASATDADET